MFSLMSSAALKGPDAGSIDQQVDTMLASPAASTLDQQVDAALDEARASSPTAPGPTTSAAELDSKLAKAAESTIDDEFADPVTLEPAGPASAAAPSPAPAPTLAEPPPAQETAVDTAAVAAVASVVATPRPQHPLPSPRLRLLRKPPRPQPPPQPQRPQHCQSPSDPSARASPPLLSPIFLKFSSLVEPLAMKLGGLSPTARQTIGWISLLTLFHAAIVWAYVLLKGPADTGAPSEADPRLIVSDEHAAKVAKAVEHEHAEKAAHAKAAGGDHAAADAHGAHAKDAHGAPAKDSHGAPKKDAHGAPAKASKAKPKDDGHGGGHGAAKAKPAAKGKAKTRRRSSLSRVPPGVSHQTLTHPSRSRLTHRRLHHRSVRQSPPSPRAPPDACSQSPDHLPTPSPTAAHIDDR